MTVPTIADEARAIWRAMQPVVYLTCLVLSGTIIIVVQALVEGVEEWRCRRSQPVARPSSSPTPTRRSVSGRMGSGPR